MVACQVRHDVLHLLGSAQNESSGITRLVAMLAQKVDPARYRTHVWFLGADGPLASYVRATTGAEVRVINWPQGARNPIGAWRFSRPLREYNFAPSLASASRSNPTTLWAVSFQQVVPLLLLGSRVLGQGAL